MMCCQIQIEFAGSSRMLACPSLRDPTAPSAPPHPPLLAALTHALVLLEELLSLADCHSDKENRSLNATQADSQEPLQLNRCRELVSRARDLAGFMLHPSSITIAPQIKQDQQKAIAAIADPLRIELQNIKASCKMNAINLSRQGGGSIEGKAKECLTALEALTTATKEAKAKVKSEQHSSKRSLLTEKIKQAEREESESEIILQTIRANPRVYGNLIEHTKVRDRTAPLHARNLDSLLKAHKFSFSQSESAPQEEERVQERGQSSRILLSEMSEDGTGGRQRRAKADGIGCSRCEVY